MLAGTNTYTGGTTFAGGTLNVGSAGALSTSGTLSFTGGTLQYSAANQTDYSSRFATTANQLYSIDTNGQAVTYATALTSQGGSLTKLGAGTLTLTAANTYTGATTINAGTLQVDGSIASPNVVVNAGDTLSGVGKIGDPQINAGGTLSPGNAANPTGTLTIVGPLGFAAGSFYNVAITPTSNSRTNVVGTTTIAGGTVQVLAGYGTYATNTRYNILNSTGGVAGTFTQATAATNFAFLTPTLSYDANDVYLTVLPSTPTPQGTPDYRTAAITQSHLRSHPASPTRELRVRPAMVVVSLRRSTS